MGIQDCWNEGQRPFSRGDTFMYTLNFCASAHIKKLFVCEAEESYISYFALVWLRVVKYI